VITIFAFGAWRVERRASATSGESAAKVAAANVSESMSKVFIGFLLRT
jgi:hypothetical protein